MPSPEATPPGMRDDKLRTQTNPALKDEIFIEKYGAETDYVYSRFRVKVSPGGGTALHYHHTYDEKFIPQDGELGLVIGEQTKSLSPGETAHVPIGTQHRFFNASTDRDITFVAEVRPAHLGFEKALHIMYGLARDGLVTAEGLPKSMVHLCLIVVMGDTSFPGVLMMALGRPVIRAVAAYARWTGEEEKLLKRYWY